MDHSHRPTAYLRVSAPRRPHPVFNTLMGLGFAALGFATFIPAAQGPAFGDVSSFAPKIASASLSYSGTDPVITGSVDAMFQALGTFVGPNRSDKQNRARIVPDALAFVSGFEETRVQMAALRASAFNETNVPHSTDSLMIEPPAGPGPRIDVASIAPMPESAALSAIDTAAPVAPVPLVLSEEIAYARADAPLTTFDSTLDASGKKVSEKELWCLATAIYFESRGEAYRGQVAVGQVVMNRTKHRLYPKTICGVVFQNQHMRNSCQFSFACDGIPERVTDNKSWQQAEEIAKGVVNGSLYLTEVGHATHYHATYVYPHWAPKMKKVVKVGHHVFYQFKRGWRFG